MLRTAVSSPLCCPESHPRVILNEAKDPSPPSCSYPAAQRDGRYGSFSLRPQDDGRKYVILSEAKDPSPVLLLSCSAKGWEIRILRPQDDGHGGLYFLPFPGLAFFLAFGLAQPAFRLG